MSAAVNATASDQYRGLMSNIRARFEIIDGLGLGGESEYAPLETAAFHLRKSIEAATFGCLIAMENGLRKVPRDAKGQWNADKLLTKVKKGNPPVFPVAIHAEEPQPGSVGIAHHIVTNKEWNLSIDEVRQIYRRTHKWLHEWNPYLPGGPLKFGKYRDELIDDIPKVWRWLLHHLISVDGEVFIAVLKRSPDVGVEIISASANAYEAQQ